MSTPQEDPDYRLEFESRMAAMAAKFEQLLSQPLAQPSVRPMSSSLSIASVATALAKAQGEFPTIPRDKLVKVTMKSGGSYTFRYAPLETILEKVRPGLAKNGLSLVQTIEVVQDNGKVIEVLRTSLVHSTGEWMSCDVPIFVAIGDNKAQAYASGVTYSRRYGVTLLLCVAADEDDDGNGGEDGGRQPDYERRQGSPQRGNNAGNASRGKAQQKPAPQDGATQSPRPPQARDADAAPASEDSPYPDLKPGQINLLRAKARGAGYETDAAIFSEFGQVGADNINAVLNVLNNG